MKLNWISRIREAEVGGVEDVQRINRRRLRQKLRILLVAALAVGTIAAGTFYLRERGLNRKLKALAGESGHCLVESGGPRWYRRVAKTLRLPLPKRPVRFESRIVTDEDMPVVGRAKMLRHLRLVGSEITDAGMPHLAGLTRLRILFLYNTSIGDEGLAYFSELTDLHLLFLPKSKVSDAGLVHLKKLKKLECLDLTGTQATDAGLVHLKGFERLSWLELNNTEVTNASLAHLKSLKKLERLELWGTRVTPKGVLDFRAAMPGVDVAVPSN